MAASVAALGLRFGAIEEMHTTLPAPPPLARPGSNGGAGGDEAMGAAAADDSAHSTQQTLRPESDQVRKHNEDS
eukprot:674692-Prorocentrum_minimum.AAC.1